MATASALTVRLLGPLAVERGGEPVALPRSRKVRALLGYLALAERPPTRSHLCEILFDLPSDPRGELRWCLSKLRAVVDTPERARLVTAGDTVALDLEGCDVDALRVAEALRHGLGTLYADRLAALADAFGGHDLLEGLELAHSAAFSGWLVAERRRFRSAQAAVLEHRVGALSPGSDAALAALETWLAIAPFDRRAHARHLDALASRGLLREGDEHLAATARRFEGEGQDWAPIGHAWRAAKTRHAQARPDGAGGDATAAVSSVARVPSAREETAPPALDAPVADATRRASLVVMPFAERGGEGGATRRGGIGDGLADDVVTRLAKLRSVFVIAQGTMFALADRRVGSEDAGRRLDVDYVASGSFRRETGGRLTVTVQLAETRTARIVWAEELTAALDDAFSVQDTICDRIVSSIAAQIEASERNRAILRHPSSLNAWEAYHRGLWHMMRFHREDNEQARQFFRTAVRLDPTFARPHAGLSFTHFQDAFLGWREPAPAIEAAYAAASEGVLADELDPSSHWALGRAHWLQGVQDACLGELRTAVELSPNFALGHYTLAFVQSQSGDPLAAIGEADQALALSPVDPLLFGIFSSRAMALMRVGRHGEAADIAARSARLPNAHVHIRGIAMVALALAGRLDEARAMAALARRERPGYATADFLAAFRFAPEAEALVRGALARIDL